MKLFSFDAETNGLYGQTFAIGAVVTDDRGEIARYVSRCPIVGEIDKWVAENVLPHIRDVSIDQDSYQSLLNNFFGFYKEHKKDADVIAHVAHPVETKLLRDMIELDLEARMWEGPFPLIDVAGVLKAKGEDPNSVDGYIKKNGLQVPFDGNTHHPLYDAIAAGVAYRHLMKQSS